MTDATPADFNDDEDLTAAEYALGVLDRDERAAAEARSGSDPEFGEAVLKWVVRLEGLIDGVEPVQPSADLWPRIDAVVGRPRTRSAPLRPSTPPAPANDLPRGSMLWRIWAISASAVAAAAILFIVIRAPGVVGLHGRLGAHGGGVNAGGGALIATLALTESKASAFTVAYDPSASTIYAAPDSGFSIPLKRAAELWLIPADGKPRPMGLVDPTKPATMPMPPQFRNLARDQATLAISIEPEGGSKTGLPTGPVVAAGKLAIV